MGYAIKFSAHAARYFRKLPRQIQVRLYAAFVRWTPFGACIQTLSR